MRRLYLRDAQPGDLIEDVYVLTTKQLAAASNLFGWVVGVIGVVLFSHAGAFAWPLFAKVLTGTLPGIYLGALVSRRITRQWLLRTVAVIAAILGVKLIFR